MCKGDIMKKFKFLPTLLLSMITGSIYAIYMWCKMVKANNQIAEANGIPKIRGYIASILLGVITCGIYTIYWNFKFQQQQVKILQAYGKPVSVTSEPILLWLLMYVPVLSFYVLCTNYNNGIDAYQGR